MLFDGVWRNAADNFFLINLIVLFQGALFFDYKYRVIDSTEQEETTHRNHTTFSAVIVASVYAVFTAILIYQVYHCLPQGMQTYISRYVRSTKLARKLIEWVTLADQTQQTVKDRVVYYRYT